MHPGVHVVVVPEQEGGEPGAAVVQGQLALEELRGSLVCLPVAHGGGLVGGEGQPEREVHLGDLGDEVPRSISRREVSSF